ncbi:MAG: DUF2497 domain-containing protein [Alphaproteobacteria bacterium]|nr:DUF2497 domain-containing protein [Alphaproteobacteria bacterium]
MAEENVQDMEMEDILSSIKNILEEDQAISQSAPITQADVVSSTPLETPSQSAEINQVETEDILELSSDMRLEETPVVEEINIDAELDKVDQLPDNINEGNENAGVTLGSEDLDSDPFYETDTSIENIDTVVEDIVPETINNVSNQDTSSFVEMVEQPISDGVEEVENTENSFADNIITEQESVELVEENNISVETEPVIHTSEPQISEVVEQVVEQVEEQAPEQEAKADDAVDVSASIISNFAKLFSQETPTEQETKTIEMPAEPIRVIGDAQSTLADIVSDVIMQIIGKDVATHWQEGLDYHALAHQEIARQTKEWLELNLPSVVEKIVKQEIERVMAKVGNHQ